MPAGAQPKLSAEPSEQPVSLLGPTALPDTALRPRVIPSHTHSLLLPSGPHLWWPAGPAAAGVSRQLCPSSTLVPPHHPVPAPRSDPNTSAPPPHLPQESTQSCRGWLMASQSDLNKSLSAQSQFLNKSALNYIDL